MGSLLSSVVLLMRDWSIRNPVLLWALDDIVCLEMVWNKRRGFLDKGHRVREEKVQTRGSTGKRWPPRASAKDEIRTMQVGGSSSYTCTVTTGNNTASTVMMLRC
jgi:hypothetical protein